MRITVSVLVAAALAPLAFGQGSFRALNENVTFIESVSSNGGNAVLHARGSSPFANGDKVFCYFRNGGGGMNADSFRAGNDALERTVTAATSTTFELLAEDGSTPIAYDSQTTAQVAMDTLQTFSVYGACGRFSTVTLRSGEVGGQYPLSGTAAYNRVNYATATVASDSTLRYNSLISHGNTYSTATCDGVSAANCSTEETKISTTIIGNNVGSDVIWMEAARNLAFLCRATNSTRYCGSALYYLRNCHRYLNGRQFSGIDPGLGTGGLGSNTDWAAFANRYAVETYRMMYDRLDAGDKTLFQEKMLTGVGTTCTNLLDIDAAPYARATGASTTLLFTNTSGLAVGDNLYIVDDLSYFEPGAGLASLTVSGEVATITTSQQHSLTHLKHEFQVSGASDAGLNGTFRPTAYTSTTIAYAAPGVADGTYTTGVTVQLLRTFDSTTLLGNFVKVTGISGSNVSLSYNFSATGKGPINAPVWKVTPWATGQNYCGAMWFDNNHTSSLASLGNTGISVLAQNVTPSDTSIFLDTASVRRIPSGATTLKINQNERFELLGISAINYGTGEITVTRGKAQTTPGSWTAASNVFVSAWSAPYANSFNVGAPSFRYWGDPSNNLTYMKTTQGIQTATMLCYDSATACKIAEHVWFYFYGFTYPLLRDYQASGISFSGGTYGYDIGRAWEYFLAVYKAMKNTIVSPPAMDLSIARHLPCAYINRFGAGPTQRTWFYLDSDSGSDKFVEEDDIAWLAILYDENSSTPCLQQAVGKYVDEVRSSYPAELYIPWLSYITETAIATFKQAWSTAADYFFFTNKADTVVNKGADFYAFASRTSHSTSASAMFVDAGIDDPRDHLPAYLSPHAFALIRNDRLLFGGNITAGRFSGFAYQHNNALCVTASGATALDVACGTNFTGYTYFGVGGYTPMTHTGNASIRLSTVDCAARYKTPVTDCTSTLAHLVNSSDPDPVDHILLFDRIQTSASRTIWKSWGFYAGQWTGATEIAQSPERSYTRSGDDVEVRSTQYDYSALARIAYKSSGATVDEVAANYGTSWADRLRVRYDGTDFEHATVMTTANGTSEGQPTVDVLSCAGTHCVVQVQDASTGWVVAAPRTNTLVTSLTFTSTHTGSRPYAVSGLVPGAYDVTVGGSPVDSYVATSTDHALLFSSTAGVIVISQSGANLIALSPSSLSFAATVGGASPANQTFDATCTDDPSACTLSITTNQTWCSASPTSGASPQTITASIDSSGLPEGTHHCLFTVTAAEAANSPQLLDATVVMTGTPGSDPTITTTTVPDGAEDVAYSTTLAATGGTLPYSWSVVSGALPSGVTLSSAGVVSGTPTANGVFNFTARVTDSTSGTPKTDDQALTLTIAAAPGATLVATPTSLAFAHIIGDTDPADQTFTASCDAACSSTATVTLGGAWLSVSPSSGSTPRIYTASVDITGLAPGIYDGQIEIDATEADNGPITVPITLNVTTTELTISTSGSVSAQVGAAPTLTISASGGIPPYTFTADAALPSGLSMGPDGVITGTVTALGAGDYPVNICVEDSSLVSAPEDVCTAVTFVAQPTSGLTVTVTPAQDAVVVLRSATGIPIGDCEVVVRQGGAAVFSTRVAGTFTIRSIAVSGVSAGTATAEGQCANTGGTSSSFVLATGSGNSSVTVSAKPPENTGATGFTLDYGTNDALGSSTAATCSGTPTICTASATLPTGAVRFMRIRWTGSGFLPAAPDPMPRVIR